MKVTVFGAGSVGGDLAGRLVMSGQEAAIVARGAHLAALQQNGLALKIGDETHSCPVHATDNGSARRAGPHDRRRRGQPRCRPRWKKFARWSARRRASRSS